MKKLFTLLSILTLGFGANATIHDIVVTNTVFTPALIPTGIEIGDVIRWTQTAGSHTTTSVNIPANAATWNHSFSGALVFEYTVTVAGDYAYKCTPHSNSSGTTGMIGAFHVNAAQTSGISKIQKTTESKVYPNPFTSKVTIAHNTADKIEICTLLGETVKTFSVSNNDKTSVLDLSELRAGVYFYVIKLDNKTLETRRIIKSEQ